MNVLIQLGDPISLQPHTWAWLVRLCGRWTYGDDQTAQDLAQETLIEAWRNQHKIKDALTPAALQKWLSAIARNVCLRWHHAQKHNQAIPLDDDLLDQQVEQLSDQNESGTNWTDLMESNSALLQDALARLDPAYRDVITHRFIEKQSVADTAQQMQITTGAVKVRQHRAVQKLARLLSSNDFEETPIWCPVCGRHKLLGQTNPEAGELILTCPHCEPEMGQYVQHRTNIGLFDGVKEFKPIYSRLMKWAFDYYSEGARTHSVPCLRCGATIPIQPLQPDNPRGRGMHGECQRCGSATFSGLNAQLLFSPDGRTFQKQHPQLQLLPESSVEADGQPMIVLAHESVTDGAKLVGLFNRDTYQLLKVVTHG